MMNDPEPQQPFFSDPDDDSDSDVASLLRDAYDVPPLPATLMQRLDRVVLQEWGKSPELAVSRATPLVRSVSAGSRWWKAAPVAACAALVLVAFLLFGQGSRAYGWASMVRALQEQGIVQLDGAGVTRWLSLSAGVVGEKTPATQTLVDVRQEFVLEHDRGESRIRRRRNPLRLDAADHDRLVLAFLLGTAQTQAGAERLSGARLIGERWEYARLGSRKVVSLETSWQTERAERFDVRLSLDPTTRLPIACNVAGQGVPANTLTCSYPTTDLADLRSNGFPAAAMIVDVEEEGASAVNTAAIDRGGVPPTNAASPLAAGELAAVSMTGAASQWKPVEFQPRPRSEVVLKINAILEELWQSQQLEPAAAADDEELLRRVYLDLAGRTPTVHEIRTYLANRSGQRYEELVDRLLESKDHASHLATIWRTFLIPEGVDLTAFGGVDAFDQWLAGEFGKNASYDGVVRNLVLAGGRLSRSGPLLFYSAAKLDPDVLAARSARVFLGMRLECAQCHNHPFEPWTQEEFWNLAAFFAQISRPQGELKAVSTVMQVRDVDHGDVRLPKSDTVIPPRFLNGGSPAAGQGQSRREQLARWLTAVENPYFSRATANRAWAIMFGKGIVDPVDDLGVRHPPKSPQLLDLLAGHFASTGFDLRELFRTIALSRAYRLSSGAATADPNRTEWFAQMNVKTLSAEQVYDCMTVATLLDAPAAADPMAFNVKRYGNTDRATFLQQFRTPAGRSTEYLGGIPQALTLMNGGLIDSATGLSKSGLLKSLDAPFFTNRERIEVLYLAALSRYPRPSEWRLLDEYIDNGTSGAELRENLSDILWALLNSAEFTMNH